MRSVYLIRSGYQVETRYDYLSVPHDLSNVGAGQVSGKLMHFPAKH